MKDEIDYRNWPNKDGLKDVSTEVKEKMRRYSPKSYLMQTHFEQRSSFWTFYANLDPHTTTELGRFSKSKWEAAQLALASLANSSDKKNFLQFKETEF